MKTRMLAATALLLLALTGCAGAAETAPTDEPVDNQTATSAPEETETPLVAETPAELSEDDAEAAFVERVRAELRPDNVIPNATDQQLIDAGYAACEAVAEGKSTDQISVIEGEETTEYGYYTDSLVIISATASTLCPR